jgi:hypothetical protein
MNKMIKPNIPPDSCDHIDRVIELSERIADETDFQIAAAYHNVVREECELIRTINTQLRTASKFWYDKRKKRGA